MNPATQALIKDFLELLLAEPAILTKKQLNSLKALFQEIDALSDNDFDKAVTKIGEWSASHRDILRELDRLKGTKPNSLKDITAPAPDEKEATQFPNFNITTPAPDKSPEIQNLALKESTPKPIITYLKEALEKIIKILET